MFLVGIIKIIINEKLIQLTFWFVSIFMAQNNNLLYLTKQLTFFIGNLFIFILVF